MSRNYLLDLVERAGSTFFQAAAGVIVASGGFGANVWEAAAVAGLIAVMKSLAARNVGDSESASLVK